MRLPARHPDSSGFRIIVAESEKHKRVFEERPALEKNVEPSGEITTVRSEELSKMRVGNIGSDVARIEVISQVEATQRKTDTILLCDLKLFGEFRVQGKEGREPRLIRVSHAHKVLLGIAYGIWKAGARFDYRRDRNAMRQRKSSPRYKTIRNVKWKIRKLSLAHRWFTKVTEVGVEIVKVALCF